MKGKLVGVQGKLSTGSYVNKDNIKVYTTEILAQNIKILEWVNKESDSEGGYTGIEGFHPTDNTDIPF